jgi:glutathione S-transferase
VLILTKNKLIRGAPHIWKKARWAKCRLLAQNTDFYQKLLPSSTILRECNYPDKPILPSDAFQRAKGFELTRIAELYVELSGRRFLPEILMGIPKSESNRALMLPILNKAFACLEEMATFSPYLRGEKCTQADLVVRYSLKTGVMVGEKIFEVDFMENTQKLQKCLDIMNNDQISKIVDAQAKESFPEFMGYLQKAFAK